MDLYFFTDSRFAKSSHSIYNLNGSLGDVIWDRYLEHFDNIFVVARVKQNAPINKNAPQTSNPRVHFVELPYYLGPFQYLRNKEEINNIIKSSIKSGPAYICRLPGTIGKIAVKHLKEKNIPYAVEVVGDPKDSLSYKATHKIIPAILSYYSARELKRCVSDSAAALYVTNETLQKRYPVKSDCFSIGVSDVMIDSRLTIQEVKPFPQTGTVKIISMGSLEQMYKSPDIVLKAMSILHGKDLDFHLSWLGAGKYKLAMEDLAKELGIIDKVSFVGNVSKTDVNEYLRSSDIYVQASRTEGLPRALVEAMSFGLPCIGTRVGGIPELLSDDYLMKVDDYEQLATMIIRFIDDPLYVNRAKEQNFIKSKEYNPTDLNNKRNQFFKAVKYLYK